MARKFIIAAAVLASMTGGALAADLPTTKGPPVFAPPPPAFTWTGFYIGAQVGYQWGTSDPYLETNPANVFVTPLSSYTDEGVVGGGHAGFDYQISQIVLGVEGDIEGSSYSGVDVRIFPPGIPVFTDSTSINLEGSIRGRIGWAWDRVLLYGTGGAAFASIGNYSVDATKSDGQHFGRVGWTAGGGIEYAIDQHWSVRAEYRYTDFGGYNSLVLTNISASKYAVHELERNNRAELGFSYKF